MRRGAVLLAAALVLSACAGPGRLSAAAAEDLQAHVAAVRDSAETGDAGAAAAELDELRGAVGHWVETGGLDRARADQILAAAGDVEAALGLLPAPEEPPPVEAEEPPVEEPDVEDADEEATPPEEPEEQEDDQEDDEEDDDNSGPGSGGSGEDDGGSGPG